MTRTDLWQFACALACAAPTMAGAAGPTLQDQVAIARTEGVWIVQPNQYLIGISEALSPYSRARQRTLQAAIFQRNPHAFRPGDRNFLYPGSRLQIEFPLEEVGRIELVSGEVTLMDANRRLREPRDGGVLYLGDRFRTAHGTVSLVFSDGARIELRPRTVFEVEDYVLPSGRDAGVFHVRVLDGAVRSTTGSIGKARDDNYRLQTPVINLGVRGTEYAVVVCGSAAECLLNEYAAGAPYGAATYVGVREGAVGVANKTGSYDLERGQCLKVESPDAAPESIPPPRGLYAAPPRVRASCATAAGDFAPCP